MFLFHVSPRKLIEINPKKSQGAYARAWYCDCGMLEWTITHIADHHSTEARKLYIHVICIDSMAGFVTLRPGIYTTQYAHVVRSVWRYEE